MMKNPIIKFGILLFTICFLSAAFLSGVNLLTKEKIAFQKYQAEQNALREVMPEAAEFEAVKKDSQTLYYKALDKDKNILGFCFMAYGKGYSSQIETMVGMSKEGKINAIKILLQSETPGLGSKIAELASSVTLFEAITGKAKKDEKLKPWFEGRFSSKKIDELDKVDVITGATISSSAVIKSVKKKAEEILEIAQREGRNDQ